MIRIQKLFLAIVILLQPSFIAASHEDEKITIVYNRGIAPIKFSDSNGSPSGILNDYWALLAEINHLNFNFIEVDTFSESLEMVKDGRADLHGGLFFTEDRREFLEYSEPLIDLKSYIYSSPDLIPPDRLDQVRGLVLGTVQGEFSEDEIKKVLPEERIIVYDDFESMFRSALAGDIKVFISSDIHLHYFLSQNNMENPFSHGEIPLYNQSYFGATAKGNSTLINKIRESQKELNIYDIVSLQAKWMHYKSFRSLQPTLLTLTDEEITWIKDHPQIYLGSDFNWPPYDFIDTEDNHSGVSSGIIDLLEEKTDLTINIVSGTWSSILEKVRRRELDGLACAVPTDKGKEYLTFSPPYFTASTAIISRKENRSIKGMESLINQKVAVNRDSYIHEWLEKNYPEIKILIKNSNNECLESVSYNEAYAYIANLSTSNFIINQELFTNLKVYSSVPDLRADLTVAIGKNQPILQNIINKALKNISDEELLRILKKWSAGSIENTVILSGAERSWLRDKAVITVTGDSHYAPISFLDSNGKYAGIISDIFNLIEKKSGLGFKYIPTNTPRESLELIKEGQLYIYDGIQANDETSEFMDFSDVYFNMDLVLVTQDSVGLIKSLNDIGSRKIGIIREQMTEDLLEEDYPWISPFLFDTKLEGLRAVSKGSIDIFVIDIPAFEYYTQKSFLTNLKISGFTPYTLNLRIGVKKGEENLLSILNKSLELITENEKNAIYSNWINRGKPLIDYSLLWIIVLVGIIILLVIFLWNRILIKEIILRKEAEKKAYSASQAKSNFLANMSHEIRTPMNSILGFTELLDAMIIEQEQKSYIQSIRSSGNALLNLINDILDLSKIEAGKFSIKPVPTNLRSICNDMLILFKDSLSLKKISFEIQYDSAFPDSILIDGPRLRQILVNLIGNAVKFTHEGIISLSVSLLNSPLESGSVDFSVKVKDTGIGIPQDQLKVIFDKFNQQEGQDNNVYGGTGLGLSISSHLTSLLGGDLSVKSRVGIGSEFTVIFKNISTKIDLLERSMDESNNLVVFDSADILVVDDIKDNRILVSQFFKNTNLVFHEAGNGEEALEILMNRKIDMVFLDLRMPDLNGYETIDIMKKNETLSGIPVIALTASIMGKNLEKVEEYVFNGYLRKPVSREQLVMTMMKFLTYREEKRIDRELIMEITDVLSDDIAVFYHFLKSDFMPMWKRIKDKGDFSLITDFSRALKMNAEEHGMKSLFPYTELLEGYAESSDILMVEKLMNYFPKIIENLGKLLSEQGYE